MARKASRGFTLIEVFLSGTLLLVVIGMLMQINKNYLDQIEAFDLHFRIAKKLDYWNSEVLSSMNQAGSYQSGSFYDDEMSLLFQANLNWEVSAVAKNSVHVKFSLPHEKEEGSLGWSSVILRDDVLPNP